MLSLWTFTPSLATYGCSYGNWGGARAGSVALQIRQGRGVLPSAGKRSLGRAYWPFKKLRPARLAGAADWSRAGPSAAELDAPPAVVPSHLPRGSAATSANHRWARRPSSAWSRLRGRSQPTGALAEAVISMPEAERGGAADRGGLGEVGWSVAAVERSGKVSLEVKTAAELGAQRWGGGAGVSGPGRGPSRAGRTLALASRGAIAQQRIPGAPALGDFPAPGSGPPRRRLSGLSHRGGGRKSASEARASPISARICVAGPAPSGHVPRPQAARRGRRVSEPPSALSEQLDPRPSPPPRVRASPRGSRRPHRFLLDPITSPRFRAPVPPRTPTVPQSAPVSTLRR